MSAGTYAKDLWRRKDFTTYLALGSIKARNAGTALGLMWWVVGPLLLAAIYFFLFGQVFGAADGDRNYLPFLLSGIFPFYYSQGTLVQSTSVLLVNANLMTNVAFPRLSLVMAGTMESAFGFLASILVCLAFTSAAGFPPGIELLALPAVFLIQTGFNLGAGALAARLSVPFRDVRPLLPYVCRIWLYTSPIVYSLERVPENLQPVIAANPMTSMLDLYRWTLIGEPFNRVHLFAAIGWAVGLLFIGIWTFVRAEGNFVKQL